MRKSGNQNDRTADRITKAVEAPFNAVKRGPFFRQALFALILLVLSSGPLVAAAEPSALEQAAAVGDLEKIEKLIAGGADVNAKTSFGGTALHLAMVRGHAQAVELLKAKGADPSVPMPQPEAILEAQLKDVGLSDSPGLAVLVSRNGKILLRKAAGQADVENKVPVTLKTKFRIGSVTKQFAAAAILKLQEQGKLSVKDKLTKFFPDYPRGDEVTVHHLLTHTSGIKSFTSKPDFFATVNTRIKSNDMVDSFKNDPFDFDPGRKWSYNNSGYFLLGAIVEKVSGVPFGEFLKKEFFVPLKMNDTGVHDSEKELKNEALGYSAAGDEVERALNWDMSRAGAAGNLYSTVVDLHRWNEGIFGGKVLSQASLKAAFTAAEYDGKQGGSESGYGYGWALTSQRGLKSIGHGGGLNGFLSHITRFPEQKLTIAVLHNASPPVPAMAPAGVARRLAELYLWREMKPREPMQAEASVEAGKLDDYVGSYNYGGPIMVVTREGGRLFGQITGQPNHRIYPKGGDEFFWKVVEARVRFERDKEGKVTHGIHFQGGQQIKVPRLKEAKTVKVDAKTLESYAGVYDYISAKMVVTVKGDQLVAQLTGQPPSEIFPRTKETFFWKIVDAEVTFLKDENGKVTKAKHKQGGQEFEVQKIK